jgi:hypothetical protein
MHIQVLNKRKGPMTQSKIPQGTIHQMRGGGGVEIILLVTLHKGKRHKTLILAFEIYL